MIYLDNGATSFRKPPAVYRAVQKAMYSCANPGRGGYAAARKAADVVFGAEHGGRTAAGELGLPVRDSGLMLPCGAAGRWTP